MFWRIKNLILYLDFITLTIMMNKDHFFSNFSWSIYLCPKFCSFIKLFFVIEIELTSFNIHCIMRIKVIQHTCNWYYQGPKRQSRTPIILYNIHAHSSNEINIGMKYFCGEDYWWWNIRIIRGKIELEVKPSFFVWSTFRS